MPGFLSLRSSHTMMLIILMPIVAVIITGYTYPQYLQDSGYVAIAIILFAVAVLPLGANIQGRGYPHITHSIFDPRTKTFYRNEDFFIDQEPRPTQLVMDVWPSKEMNYCERCRKWRKIDEGRICLTCGSPVNRREVPVKFGGRWWYPYIVKTRWPISFGDFKDSTLHIMVFPHPFKTFLGFGRRESAAYLLGEEISHSQSTQLCSILAPFKRNFVGIEIPVYVGVLSYYTMAKIIEGGRWEEAMNAWARQSQDIDKLLREHAAEIFPQKQIDELLPAVYPGLKGPKNVVDLQKVTMRNPLEQD